MRRPLPVLLCAALLVSLGGCSFVFMKPPTRRACTRSRTLPILDTVAAGVSAIAYAALLIRSSGCGDDESCAFGAVAPGATVIFVPATIAFGASAGYGFVWANRCAARQP